MRPKSIKPALKVLASVTFVAIAFWFIFLSIEDNLEAILRVLEATPWQMLAMSLVLTCFSIVLTAALWLLVFGQLAKGTKPGQLAELFFATQLGKYIPGSIWNIAAQASLLRGYGVPAWRVMLASGAFLYLLLITALSFGLLASFELFSWPLNFLALLLGFVSLVGLHPIFLRKFLNWRAKSEAPQQINWSSQMRVALVSLAIWLVQTASIYVLVPSPHVYRFDFALFLTLLSSICLSFAAGLIVPLAPAGLGVREAVLIAVLTPSLGIAQAGAIAILLRVMQVAVDLTFGLISWAAIALRKLAKS